MDYLLSSFLKTLYFCYNSMVFLSIYNILYTIGKLWFPSFQWDCCQGEILTYFLSSQLSIQISYLSSVQLVLFKIPEYSRQCKIPHSKIPSSTCCITQDKQSGIVFCHSWPTPILTFWLWPLHWCCEVCSWDKCSCTGVFYDAFKESLDNVFVFGVHLCRLDGQG